MDLLVSKQRYRKDPYLYSHQVYKVDAESGWIYGESQEPNARRPELIWRYDFKRCDVKEGFDFDPRQPANLGKKFSNRMPMGDWIQFPLVIGKKYKLKEDWTNGEGYDEFDVSVEAFEKVKTPAGDFDAFRIKGRGFWTRTVDGNFSGIVGRTMHYAPAAKKVIRTEYFSRTARGGPWADSLLELVKWEPKAELSKVLSGLPASPPAPSTSDTVAAPAK